MVFQGKIEFRKPITINGKPHGIEHVTTLPTWGAGDEGRVVHAEDTGKLWFGTAAAWEELTPAGVGTHDHNSLYYTETEIDNFFEGTAAGKKQVDWARITTKPSTFAPDTHGNGSHSVTFITAADVTYGNLNSNGDVGTGADQVAVGNHNHNSIYFSETELGAIADGASGADLIGATVVGSGTAVTVQGVLEELNTAIGGLGAPSTTLDDAYSNGSTIAVDGNNLEITLDTSKNFTIKDATDVSKFSVTAGAGESSIYAETSGGVEIAAATNVWLSAGTYGSIGADDTGVNLTGYNGGLISVAANGKIDIDSINGQIVEITSDTGINADTAAFSIDGTSASNVTVTGANLTLSTITSGNLVLNTAGAIDADGVSATFTLTSTDYGSFTIDTAGSIVMEANGADGFDLWDIAGNAGISAANGSLYFQAGDNDTSRITGTTTGTLVIETNTGTGNNSITINAKAGGIDIDAANTKSITIDSGSFSIDAVQASNVTVTGANLTLSTATSGSVIITSVGTIDMNGDVDISGKLTLGELVIPGSAPSTPVAGSAYFNSSTRTLYIHDGTNWTSIALS